MPYSKVINELPALRRYRIVIIDESHNLRNREGRRYRAILDYIYQNDSRCILLSATPYNKSYLDLSSQLRLFVHEDKELGIRPEMKIKEIGETEFIRRHQCPVRSLAAFEKSDYADDWRELMRLYLVRRTRKFIQDNYAKTDASGRKYLTFENGTHFYFPTRMPLTVRFKIDDGNTDDQYSKLYSDEVVESVNSLYLPRYGLGNYLESDSTRPTDSEAVIIRSLSRAGKRLMGFSRTNLFKRLESGGPAFLQSVERHLLRNYLFIYAIEKHLPLPIGAQGADYLDGLSGEADFDYDRFELDDDEDQATKKKSEIHKGLRSETEFRNRAKEIYSEYSSHFKNRFKWIRSSLFTNLLLDHLKEDSSRLIQVLTICGKWEPDGDTKLIALKHLLTKKHPREKVLIFTQFADTVSYLLSELKRSGIKSIEGVTGESEDPSRIAWRFSPDSSEKRDMIKDEDEIRILLSTDVLSEGQNLQDSFIVVNYDIPWAIIRLVQRAGRVDRIGQKSEKILCYSFLPADGVERLINLRNRVRQRLHENAQVLGADEQFFEGDSDSRAIVDLYNEKSGILDGEDDNEVDLSSKAYQIWKNAIDRNPSLEKIISNLPSVVYSTKDHEPTIETPAGALVYARTADGNDSLAWVDSDGNNVTESQTMILKAAECTPDTPALPKQSNHHDLVLRAIQLMMEEEKAIGGQLGRPSSARFKTYERLKRYSEVIKGTLLESKELLKAIDEIYRYPLRESAKDVLNRQLKTGINDEELANLVQALRDDGRLYVINEDEQKQEPRLICSLGLYKQG